MKKVTDDSIKIELEAAEAAVKATRLAAKTEVEAAEAAVKAAEAAAEAKIEKARNCLAKAARKEWLWNFPFQMVNRNSRDSQSLVEAEGTLYLNTRESQISDCTCCSLSARGDELGEILARLRQCLELRGCTKLIVRVTKKEGWAIVNLDEIKPVTKTRELRNRYGEKVVETYEETPQWTLASRTFPLVPNLLEWEFYDPTP